MKTRKELEAIADAAVEVKLKNWEEALYAGIEKAATEGRYCYWTELCVNPESEFGKAFVEKIQESLTAHGITQSRARTANEHRSAVLEVRWDLP